MIKDSGLVGEIVEWEKSGLGRGEIEQGEVLAEIPPGTSNREAMDAVEEEYRADFVFRPTYERFVDETHTTHRAIVAVEQESERARPVHWFYAPNVAELTTV